jgi:multicomponent Na+:H+ antiporter subunit C
MNVLYAFVTAALFGCGLYMVLSRNVVRLLLGLSLVATAVNLMIFQTGRIQSVQPPLIRRGASQLGESADPLPQALILTAIVIGFALTVMLAALALRTHRDRDTLVLDGKGPAERLGDPFAESAADDR